MKNKMTKIAFLLFISQTSLASNLSVTSQIGNGLKIDSQWLAALYSHNQHLFYTDVIGNYSTNRSWSGGLGLGYRDLLSLPRWGIYLLADYNHTASQPAYWSLNPGLEFFSSNWDWRLNTYFPLNHKNQQIKQGFASQFADYQHVKFRSHQQYDHIYTERAELAPGFDLSTTWHPYQSKQLAISLGGYHFHFKESKALHGVYLGLEYPINHFFKLMTAASYDNYLHNFISLGIKLNLSSEQTPALIPIVRNLANRQQATLIPSSSYKLDQGGDYLAKDNIWFFQPSPNRSDNAAQSCTAEHPCSDFSQAALTKINSIAPYANFYLKTGRYYSPQRLHLYNGQSINGRSVDYRHPDQNIVIIGSLDLSSDTTLSHVQLLNDPLKAYTTAITINNADRVKLQQVKVGELSAHTGYPIAIETENSRQLSLDHTHLIAYMHAQPEGANEAIGIYSRSSQLLLQNSLITAYTQNKNGISRASAIVTLATNPQLNNQIKLLNSKLTAVARNQTGLAIATALSNDSLDGQSLIDIQQSTLAAHAFSKHANAYAQTLNNHSEELQQSHFTIQNSRLIAHSHSQTGLAQAIAIKNISELAAKDYFTIQQTSIINKANSQNSLAEANAIDSTPAFEAQAYFKLNATTVSTHAFSQQGTAKALVIASMPFFEGNNQFIIKQSTLAAQASSPSGNAFATVIQTQHSQLLLQDNFLISSVSAAPTKRQATIINKLEDNAITEKNNQYIVLASDPVPTVPTLSIKMFAINLAKLYKANLK